MQKKFIVAALCVATSVTSVWAQTSGEGPWVLRARALHLDSADKDTTGLNLSINNKTFGEIDVSYFLDKNIALELMLTNSQQQRLYASGTEIGTFKHLPPSLLLQYHFTNVQGFKPYLGAGVNYTRFTSVNLPTGVTLDKNNWGGALQVGMDMPLDKNWSLNFDIKKVYIRTDVYVNVNSIGAFKVDPILYGVGVGYRF